MARIAGVNLPVQKHVWVGLQSIFGIGRTRSKLLCGAVGVNPATKIRDLSEPEVESLRALHGITHFSFGRVGFSDFQIFGD